MVTHHPQLVQFSPVSLYLKVDAVFWWDLDADVGWPFLGVLFLEESGG